MAFLELNNISRNYGTPGSTDYNEVLHNINLHIEEGEFVAIVGYSGTGKTTLINMVAGLVKPSTGDVKMEGQLIEGPSPERGIVFQNYSLLPWLTVYGNVALAVNQVFPKWTRKEKDQHIRRFVDMVSLSPAIHKRPKELSGGMRQRVAVARTLAMDPKVLLLDEPLGALDALTRAELQGEIARIWENQRKTVLMITNSVDEGLLLADRIIPLTMGPGATLGPEFTVNLPRPRRSGELNQNPEFAKLRREITEYLIDIGQSQRSASENIIPLPDIQPLDPSERLSRTWI